MGRFAVAALLLYGPYLWCRLRDEPTNLYGLDWRLDRRGTLEALAATLLTLVPLTGIALWWPWDDLPHSRSGEYAFTFAASGLAAAVIEETFYRGFLQTILRRRLPFLAALTITSGLFAASHLILFPRLLFLATFFPGLVMGTLRERNGTVAPGALYHFLCNIWAIWFFPAP
jgi:hypothetical protein